MNPMRRTLVSGLLLGLAALGAAPAMAQNTVPVTFMTAGDGSAFLPYGQGIAAYLATKGVHIEIKKSGGSNENLSAVDASPVMPVLRCAGSFISSNSTWRSCFGDATLNSRPASW